MANIRQTILPPVRVYQVDGLQSVCFMSLDDSGRLFVGDGMGRVVSTNTHGNNALISLGSLPDNCVVHHTVRNGVVYYTYWNGETCGIKKRHQMLIALILLYKTTMNTAQNGNQSASTHLASTRTF